MESKLSHIARKSATGSRLTRGWSFGFGLLRRNLWLWPLLAAVGLAVAGLWIRQAVEASARHEMREGLQAILKSNVEALRIWLDTEKEHIALAASDVPVRKAAGSLIALAADPATDDITLSQSELQSELKAALRPVLASKRYSGYALRDANRRIVASDRPELIGVTRNSTSYDIVGRALERGPLVSQPFPSVVLMRDEQGELRAGQPTMFAAAPLRNMTGDVVGVLSLRIRPDQDFARILQIARPGKSGETYAFDRDGLLLSESRFTPELARIGLVPDQKGVKSQLNVSIRDPGVDLTTGQRPTKPRAEQPLTYMAAHAIQAQSDAVGSNVEGYRDYRGTPVVGAWTWLKDYDFGVATEMDVAEAYDSLYIMRRAFWSLFGLLAASSVLIFVFSLAMARLQKTAQSAALAAKKLGQYNLEAKLGEGGMGVVYRGCHTMLRRATAIKLLHPEKTTDEAIARFEREVQLTCQLNHPNTIAIFDYGRTPEGLFFYAMEYLDGLNLDSLVTRFGPQPEGRVIHILAQVCGSLAEAHEIGLVHRDIKPANIILNRRGGESDVVKVLDFGLVKAVDARKQANLTSANAVLGTPLYMSPEAIETADAVDGRSDLYAVAAVGYFLLTGQPPFDGKSVVEICMHQINTPPKPLAERLGKPMSPELEAVILRGLAKKPAERYATARAFAAALLACPAAATWTANDADAWWQAFTTGQQSPAASNSTTGSVHHEQTLVMTAEMPR